MTMELIASIIFFVMTAFGLIFSLTRTSSVGAESFPNRGRFFVGLILWFLVSILAIFMSFSGYGDWFVPIVYPVLKISFLALFVTGFFLLLTAMVAFPVHLDYFRREISGRSDRISILENIRQIAAQPYPVTESFSLALREIASFLVIRKAAIFLINPSKREMYLVAQIGLDRDELRRLERFSLGQDILSRSATEQAPYISGDLATSDPATRKLILAGRPLTLSAAAIPLFVRDRSLGAMLVLSEKPYGFEKKDRMLLAAVAEALAGMVENNRLSRENLKLHQQLEYTADQLTDYRRILRTLSGGKEFTDTVKSICRYITERYALAAARLMHLSLGELMEIAGHESKPGFGLESESYRVAVINAISRGKMIVLNQEALTEDGGKYIARSTLLCPIPGGGASEYALLAEAPGDDLNITENFLTDIDGLASLMAINISMSAMRESDRHNQNLVRALLNIFKIRVDATAPVVFRQLIGELGRALPENTVLLAFIQDRKNGYRLAHGHQVEIDSVAETVFLPGEGPVGKAAATGDIIELKGTRTINQGWSDLEPVNADFLGRLFGEHEIPEAQLFIPVRVLEETSGVVAVFGRQAGIDFSDRDKGLIFLAVQLLIIRLAMLRTDRRMLKTPQAKDADRTGDVLNRINNDLATVLGRAELLSRQPDTSGRTQYTTEEIIKAAESAAASIRDLQKGLSFREQSADEAPSAQILTKLNRFLEDRRVTGNLYMFENNQPVMLGTDFEDIDRFLPADTRLGPVVEAVLTRFAEFPEEGEELFIQARRHDRYAYLSFLRGGREKMERFNPGQIDFGAPDVMPREIIAEDHLSVLARNQAEVSFDRFGRRPTYISFRFLCRDQVPDSVREPREERGLAGLKILAIDDQQMILDLLSGICASLGVELAAFQDAAQGLESLRKTNYDLVMVDLVMGNISGWDVARQIKDLSPEMPIIMMSGWGMQIKPEEAAARGVDFTLAKPFRIEQLTEIINQARLKYTSFR